MQNEYALRACRALASSIFPLELEHALLGGFQKLLTLQIDSCVPMFASGSHAGAEKRYPTSTAASRQRGSGAASAASGAPKLVIVTGSVGFQRRRRDLHLIRHL